MPEMGREQEGKQWKGFYWLQVGLEALGVRQPANDRTHTPPGHRTITTTHSTAANSIQASILGNSVCTAKYTLLTFVPRFVYEQLFAKYANMFFLVTGGIQTNKQITPTSQYGTLLPLLAVLTVTCVKEVYEDGKRHRQDQVVNSSKAFVFDKGDWVRRAWRDLRVGNLVRVSSGDYFPADICLLSSSEAEGSCYIETSQLDGETNLKSKQALPETTHLHSTECLEAFSELPNNSLYTFDGTLELGGKRYALAPDQLLLRGAQLRNTEYIVGIVVFTGHETKLMKNSTVAPVKKTKVEHMVNSQIIFLFVMLLVISMACSAGSLFYQQATPFNEKILLTTPTTGASLLITFCLQTLTFIVLFNNLIPISLVITIEVVKLCLAYLIEADLDIYYPGNDTPTTVRTSSLVEELGQVDYIFSDKTGTLTCNIMEFKMASVGGLQYADRVPEGKQPVRLSNGRVNGYYSFDQLALDAKGGASVLQEFLTLLAVCHSVIPEKSNNSPDGFVYQSASPDETALVEGARQLGYHFVGRRPKFVTVSVDGQPHEFQILATNEFNSTRKRMSVLVRMPSGKIKLYIKGADTVIYDRLDKKGNEHAVLISEQLSEYATMGLRTLCLASRDVSEEEFAAWEREFEAASTTLDNRAKRLEEVAEQVERDLVMVGATAIEDKLQDGVPDTISTLMEAGIKVWVLTGDRQETAINIGYACKLITPGMEVIVCNQTTLEATKSLLSSALTRTLKQVEVGDPFVKVTALNRLMRNVKKSDLGKFDKNYGSDTKPMALVIDGKSLSFALDPECAMTFLHLAMLCKAVCCCRVSPLQKALVVRLVRENVAQTVTLAIGDGANDVTMIQAAHVGIGISGQEGLQAARSADFAIAQFRFLRKLLLVHGGWAYSRICKVVVFSFYKNITLYLIQLWYAIYNQLSGQSLFETWSSVSSYNVLWTLLAPFTIGIFDQYVSATFLDKYPEIYHQGQRDVFYHNKIFFQWIGNSIFHSLAVFFLWKWTLGEGGILPNGLVVDNWTFGEMVYATTLLTVLIKTCLIIDLWVVVTAVCVLGSFALFFTLFPIYVTFAPTRLLGLNPLSPELYGLNTSMWLNLTFWVAFFLIAFAVNLRDVAWKAYKRNYRPKPYHIVQEIQKYRIPDYRPQRSWFTKATTIVQLQHATTSQPMAAGGRSSLGVRPADPRSHSFAQRLTDSLRRT